jgi:hypothetical protein
MSQAKPCPVETRRPRRSSLETATCPEIVRSFWHGPALGPYQLLCLNSFRVRGHTVELYTYDHDLEVPAWVTLKDAGSIWSCPKILVYRSGFGCGSPSLHSNLFRYALLHKEGGWWIDLDILLLRPALPEAEFFHVRSGYADEIFTGILKFPKQHPLLAEALARCVELGENAYWGQTGAELLTSLVAKHGLSSWTREESEAIPVQWFDLPDLFNPRKAEDVRARCSSSLCLHLFNEAWRGSGIPSYLAPPPGSYLDECLASLSAAPGQFAGAMTFDHVERWIINRKTSIQREFETVSLRQRIDELTVQNRELRDQTAAVLDSTSWRVTAPLRAISRFVSRKR